MPVKFPSNPFKSHLTVGEFDIGYAAKQFFSQGNKLKEFGTAVNSLQVFSQVERKHTHTNYKAYLV